MRGQPGSPVSREDGDELRLEHAVEVTGHRAEEPASLHHRGRSRRDRGTTGAQLDECALEGVDEEIQIEESANLGLCEDEHA